MVKRFRLKKPEESATIEDYLQNQVFCNYEFRQNLIPYLSNISRESAHINDKLYKNMMKDPSKYFNFGLDLKSYNLMLFKHILMRIEREMLKPRLNAKIKKGSK